MSQVDLIPCLNCDHNRNHPCLPIDQYLVGNCGYCSIQFSSSYVNFDCKSPNHHRICLTCCLNARISHPPRQSHSRHSIVTCHRVEILVQVVHLTHSKRLLRLLPWSLGFKLNFIPTLNMGWNRIHCRYTSSRKRTAPFTSDLQDSVSSYSTNSLNWITLYTFWLII